MQYAFCSNSISENIDTALKKSGVEVIPVPDCKLLPSPVCSHADMLMFKASEKLWIMEKSTYDKVDFPESDIRVITDTFECGTVAEYPYDIRFNAALVGDFLFCREKYISPLILENTSAKIVDVKQGYARCSMCIVNDHSFITADTSLKNAGERCGLDVLLISPGHIILNGYNYGFIGGASFVKDNNVYFFGNISLHPDYKRIHDFIKSHNANEIILSDEAMYDFGGLFFV